MLSVKRRVPRSIIIHIPAFKHFLSFRLIIMEDSGMLYMVLHSQRILNVVNSKMYLINPILKFLLNVRRTDFHQFIRQNIWLFFNPHLVVNKHAAVVTNNTIQLCSNSIALLWCLIISKNLHHTYIVGYLCKSECLETEKER